MSGGTTRTCAAAILLLVMAGVPAARAQESQPEPLTLDAAIAIALDNNRELQGATVQVHQAEEELAVARLRRFPVFNVNLLAGERLTDLTFRFPAAAFGAFPGIGPVPAADTTIRTSREPTTLGYVTMAQPLTQLFRINAAVDARRAAVQLERERARGASQMLVATVRRLYYSLLQTEGSLRAGAEAVDAAREVDRTFTERAALRVVLRADAAEAHLRLAQAERSQVALVHALASQKEQFNQLLGRDVQTPFAAVALNDPPGGDAATDALIARATDARSEVRQARLRVEQAELDLHAKRAEYIPDVSLTLTYFSVFNVDVLPRNLAAAGIQVAWEPWDWGRRKHEAAGKGDVVAQARLAVKDAEARVVIDVREAARRLEAARADLRVAAAAQEAARERLRVRNEQIKEDLTLPGEVLQAQAQVADATSRRQQALSMYWSARADFDRAVGEEVVR